MNGTRLSHYKVNLTFEDSSHFEAFIPILEGLTFDVCLIAFLNGMKKPSPPRKCVLLERNSADKTHELIEI